MAKRKKQLKKTPGGERPSFKLAQTLTAAMRDFHAGKAPEALSQLLRLVAETPHSRPVLTALLDVAHALQEWRTYVYYGERLSQLEEGNDRASTLNNMVYACLQLQYPALAWHFAHELLETHPNFVYIDQAREYYERAGQFLLSEAAEWDELAGFDQDDQFEIMVEHDRVRLYAEGGYDSEAIPAAESFLARVPGIIAVQNNLSQAYFRSGDESQAIAIARQVLDQFPNHAHALSNMVHFTFLTAQFEAAQQYAARLAQINSDKPDWLTKQAEGFAYLGDDAQVQAAFERAEEISASQNFPLNPLMLHLGAMAYYRQGQKNKAWRLWRQALKAHPAFELARTCLAEKELPEEERNIPWYWPLDYWQPGHLRGLYEQFVDKKGYLNQKKIDQALSDYLAKRPYLLELFPHMLERGDGVTREFVLVAIRSLKSPELLQLLYDFAQSRHGPDATRLKTIQFLHVHNPQTLPEDRLVPMWIKGKQTKILSLGFEISGEPEPKPDLPKAIQKKHAEAYELILQDDAQGAEPLLREIIAAAPDFESAYNQLAVAYSMQGRLEEARALVEETHARFPDYLFARVALARMLAQEGRIQAARELVNPLLHLSKLHTSEFRALAIAQITIALADGLTESALSWLTMWEKLEPDNPKLMQWRLRIKGPEEARKRSLSFFGGERKKSKRGRH